MSYIEQVKSIVDQGIEQSQQGPIQFTSIKLPFSSKILSDLPEGTSRGLEQVNNHLVKLLAEQLKGTGFEGIFTNQDILHNKAIRAFIRNQNSDYHSTESALMNIQKFGVEVNLYDYFETWVSYGEIMLIWALPQDSDFETFILIFDNSGDIFASDIDAGVSIDNIVKEGTSLRNLLLPKCVG